MKKVYGLVVGVALLGALTLGVAASASAAQWYVGGKALAGSEKIAESIKVEESIVFSMPTIKAKITCKALRSAGASEVVATGSIKLTGLVFEGCAIAEPKNCIMEPRMFAEPLEAKMALEKSSEDSAEIKPNTGKTILEFTISEESTGCGAIGDQGRQPLKGTLTIKAPNGQKEAVEQEFVGEGESSSGLTFSSAPVYVTGKFKLKLASGKQWSFH
jgi:hypothetical protein